MTTESKESLESDCRIIKRQQNRKIEGRIEKIMKESNTFCLKKLHFKCTNNEK